MLRSRGPLAYILILIAETESHIRGLDDVEQGGLSIRMVAGYREAAERKILLVAEASFEPMPPRTRPEECSLQSTFTLRRRCPKLRFGQLGRFLRMEFRKALSH